MTYGFRVCFRVPEEGTLTSDDQFIAFVLSSNNYSLKLSSGTEGTAIGKCDRLIVSGGPFESPENAQIYAEFVRVALLLMAARNRLGIDLGQNALRSFAINEYGKQYLTALLKTDHVHEDHLGITVYPMERMPLFVRMNVKGIAARPAHKFVEELADLVGRYRFISPKSEISAGLYAFSHFVLQAPARFLMLCVSLEALFDPMPRSDEAQAHVQRLIDTTLQASLDNEEKQSLTSTMEFLKRQSIAQTGRRVALQFLKDEKYDSLPAPDFFSKVYKMRNDIVHNGQIDVHALQNILGETDRFVADILRFQFVEP